MQWIKSKSVSFHTAKSFLLTLQKHLSVWNMPTALMDVWIFPDLIIQSELLHWSTMTWDFFKELVLCYTVFSWNPRRCLVCCSSCGPPDHYMSLAYQMVQQWHVILLALTSIWISSVRQYKRRPAPTENAHSIWNYTAIYMSSVIVLHPLCILWQPLIISTFCLSPPLL